MKKCITSGWDDHTKRGIERGSQLLEETKQSPKSSMTFADMLVEVRTNVEMSQTAFAKALGISPQYLNDLEHGRRLGSVAFVNSLCDLMGRGPKGRKEWHMAGARSHGWEV